MSLDSYEQMLVDNGFEAEYDCPECSFYKTGLDTSPFEFIEHLKKEHNYSESEARGVL